MKKLVIILFGCALLLVGNSCVVRTTRPVATKTVIVKKAPRNHRVVVVKGKRYYTWGGKHYRKTRRGYVYVRI